MKRLGTGRYAKSKWKYGDTVALVADREASGRAWNATDQTQKVAASRFSWSYTFKIPD